MNRVLLVGSSFSGITSYLKNHNYDYIVLKDSLTARNPDKKMKRRVVCDFSSKDSVLSAVDSIDKEITSVMTLYENYVVPTSWIAKHLGLPGMPTAAAEACTDKWLMRQAFAATQLPISPDFAIINNEQDLLDFAASHTFPLMLKPANLIKSLLITKNDTSEQLIENYNTMLTSINSVYKKYAPNRQPTIILEEFLNGTMHSVAGFADANGEPHLVESIVDLQTARDAGFNDNFLYARRLPSSLDESSQASIRQCALEGIRALDMKASPAHIEIILTDTGPKIVEIGARVGGYRERMYDYGGGIDLMAAAVDVATGNQPTLSPKRANFVCVIELFPDNLGRFFAIDHAADIQALQSCAYYKVKVQPDELVGKASNGYKRCAIIILHAQDREQFNSDLEKVRTMARVITTKA